jgi:hypothetical protein
MNFSARFSASYEGTLQDVDISENERSKLVEILLWFAFLGVVDDSGGALYCYSVFYDMKKLRRLAHDYRDQAQRFAIHPAFRPFLEIDLHPT